MRQWTSVKYLCVKNTHFSMFMSRRKPSNLIKLQTKQMFSNSWIILAEIQICAKCLTFLSKIGKRLPIVIVMFNDLCITKMNEFIKKHQI